MAIVVHLDLALAHRRMSLTDLSQAVDITLANLSILKTGKAKAVRFSTLEAICAVLGCQPGDILSYEPDDETGDSVKRTQRSPHSRRSTLS